MASPAALIYGTDAVAEPDPVNLPTQTENWFTEGNGISVQGTQVAAYWVNKIGGEISSILSAFAVPPNMSNTSQVAAILRAGFAGLLLGAPMPSVTDLDATGLGWTLYMASSENAATTSPGIVYTVSSNAQTFGTNFQIINQIAYDQGASTPWNRQKISGGSWSNWTRDALLNGDANQNFSVATATQNAHAVPLAQLSAIIGQVNAAIGQVNAAISALAAMFVLNAGNPGYFKLPGGVILQFGTTIVPAGQNEVSAQLATSFPTVYLGGAVSDTGSGGFAGGVSAGSDNDHISIFCDVNQIIAGQVGPRNSVTLSWFVIGH